MMGRMYNAFVETYPTPDGVYFNEVKQCFHGELSRINDSAVRRAVRDHALRWQTWRACWRHLEKAMDRAIEEAKTDAGMNASCAVQVEVERSARVRALEAELAAKDSLLQSTKAEYERREDTLHAELAQWRQQFFSLCEVAAKAQSVTPQPVVLAKTEAAQVMQNYQDVALRREEENDRLWTLLTAATQLVAHIPRLTADTTIVNREARALLERVEKAREDR